MHLRNLILGVTLLGIGSISASTSSSSEQQPAVARQISNQEALERAKAARDRVLANPRLVVERMSLSVLKNKK